MRVIVTGRDVTDDDGEHHAYHDTVLYVNGKSVGSESADYGNYTHYINYTIRP